MHAINCAVGTMIIGNARHTNIYNIEHGTEMHKLTLKHGTNPICVCLYRHLVMLHMQKTAMNNANYH